MPARRMRIELFDSEGNRYTVAFEGQITREKALRLLDMVELLGGMPSNAPTQTRDAITVATSLSKQDKVRTLVQKHFPIVWFSSKEVQIVYEQELKEPIGLSTVATYLSRMTNRGMLLRTGAANNLKYKLAANTPQISLRQQLQQ